MNRRRFLATFAGGMLAAPLVVEAQHSGQPARVGSLAFGPAPSPEEQARFYSTGMFWQAMKDLGWAPGQNVVAERRYGESADQLRAAAADLVRLRVDVLTAVSGTLAKILQLETKTIPIVVTGAGFDLAMGGLVASLARPGGNLTGVQVRNDELIPKKLEVLKALVPTLSRLAFLRSGGTANPQLTALYDQQVAVAARGLGLTVHPVIVYRSEEFTAAFQSMTTNRDEGLYVMAAPFTILHLKDIIELAAKHRIAAIYEDRGWVDTGGLASYGANIPAMSQLAAVLVDKILRGARPADLPVEQPTKFKLVINGKAAKALGLTIPPSLLLRADEVIQ